MQTTPMTMDIEEILSAIGAAIALLALIKGVIEYTKAQRWKKAEFLAKEIKELYNDQDVKRAFRIFDWDRTTIPVYSNETLFNQAQSIHVDPTILLDALKHHSDRGNFSPEEQLIRDIMDQLFFKLSLFQGYVDSELIKPNDVKPYLIYYVRMLADPNSDRRSEKFRKAIAGYIKGYGYLDVQRLFASLGYPLQN